MPNADAQFVFDHNMGQVRKEVLADIGAIEAALGEMHGPAGGDLLGGAAERLKRDAASAIQQIRKVQEEARQQVKSGPDLQPGQQTAALKINDILSTLYGKAESALKQAALKAGPEAANVDLKGVLRSLDDAIYSRIRNSSRAAIRDIEQGGTAKEKSVFGSPTQIPTGRPQTDLTTVGDLQRASKGAEQATAATTAAQRKLTKATDDNAKANADQATDTNQENNQRKGRRQRLAKSEDDLAAANEQAATTTKNAANAPKVVKVDLDAAQQADSKRVTGGITSGDPNFAYATRSGSPGVNVVDRSDPNNLRIFGETKGGKGYEEVEQGTAKYTRLLNAYTLQLQDQAKKDADAARAQQKADADLLKAKQAYSQKLQTGLAAQNPNYGFITKSGDQGKFVFDDPNSLNPRISKNTGPDDKPFYEEVDQSTKEYAHQLRRLQGILAERGQAEAQAAREAAEFAATQAQAKGALSQSIRDSLIARDGQYDYTSKDRRTPTKDVYTGTSRDSLTLFRQDANGDFDELTPAHKDYVGAMRRAQDSFDREAQATKDSTAAERAASQALAEAKQAQARSAEILSRLARNDPSVQYLSDSGRPTNRIAVAPDRGQLPTVENSDYFQQQGGEFAQIPRLTAAGEADARFIAAENLLTAQVNDRTTGERRAREASDRLAEAQRRSAAAALGAGGGGGFGGGLSKGLFSGGFGDSGDSPAFGLGRSLGQTIKYSALYKVFNELLTIMGQVGQEFLNVDDSVTELQVSMVGTNDVTTDFINRLQDIAAPGGFNVGDAMDQAAAGIRAYREEITKANDATGNFQNDVGTHLAAAAAKIAVIAKTTLPDAAQNTRATELGFGLDPLTGPNQVADAIANAKLAGGGLEKDISQGGANIAEVAHGAGFSLQEALNIVSKISADTDESGTLAATRFSRLIGTLQGSSGKNFLTQLNQGLPTDKQIDVNASPRDQLIQLAAAYHDLNDAQKQQTATAIGGQAQQKEFNVLIQDFPRLAREASQAQTGLADKEYQQRLDNVRNLLGQVRGELRQIVTNLATSGILSLFGGILHALIPILDAARLLTGEFNRIPAAIRNIGGALVVVLGALKAIDVFRTKGGGSFTQGVKSAITGAEGIVRPQAAAARRELNGGDPFQRVVLDPAADNRNRTFGEIRERELQGTINSGQAFKERMQAEQDYKAEIRAGTAQYKRDARNGAFAVAEGAKAVGSETAKTAGLMGRWRDGVKPDGIRKDLLTGAERVRVAITEFVAAIRGGAGEVAGAEAGAAGAAGTRGARGARGAAAEATAAEESAVVGGAGRGPKVGGFLGRTAAGLGALAAPEVLGPIAAMLAIDGALKLKDTAGSVDDAQRTVDRTRALDVPAGADALNQAATANAVAANAMREATGGLFGGIVNYLQGGAADRSATDTEALGQAQTNLANRLKSQQNTAVTTGNGPAALASQIDVSGTDTVQTSVQALLDAGNSASDVMDALSLSLKNLRFVATGAVSDLSDLQKTDYAGRAGIAAGQVFGDSRDALQQQIDDNQAGGFAGFGQAALLQGQLDALNNVGQQGMTDTATNVISDFFQKHPDASLVDPTVVKDIQKQVMDALINHGLDRGTAALAGTRATADLTQERQKFLAKLSTPEGAGQIVGQVVAVGQQEQQRVQTNAQLQAMRTGTPDRSAMAGLKVYAARLQDAITTMQANVQALDAAHLNSAGLEKRVVQLQDALTDTQVKILQQAAADAKDTIDTLERRRLALQAGASSNAQVKAIGDQIIAQELKAAADSGDADQIRRVMALASQAEIDAYMRQLDDNIAADQAVIANQERRKKALEQLPKPGDPNFIGPVGPSQPGDPNFIGPVAPGTPDPNAPKAGDPGFIGPVGETPAQRKLREDKAKRDRLKRLRGEVTPTGTAETGADVPGGTPEERRAAANAAQAERDRNSTEAAAAKVLAAKAVMDKISDHSTKEYHDAQQQYFAALNAQADLQQDSAIAQARASLYPGDKVGAARLALQDATNQIHRFAKGSKEYWDAVAKQVQAQYDYAAAQREQASLIAQTHLDLTDPVAVANQALKDAKKKLAYDQAHHADKGTLAADQIDVTNKQNAAEDAAFRQRLSDAQTADQLGTISHAAYLRFLENESKRLHAIKHKTRQQIDEMNEVDKDIKEAGNQLSGQFNLGDIKIPSVYEVRRSLQAQAAGLSANAISTTAVANTTTNNVTVNGADFARITAWLQQIFAKTGRITTTPRKA